MRAVPCQHQWVALIETWDALHAPYEAAYTRLRLADATLKENGGQAADARTEVRSLLTAARDSATNMGAAPLVEEIDALDRRAHLKLAAQRSTDPQPAAPAAAGLGLTERELEVLHLVAAGHTNGQIGQALYISRKTASVHISNILRKLGVSSRIEAATIAANETRYRATSDEED
jgi:DNA-binding CsgD family transcriptional regulator